MVKWISLALVILTSTVALVQAQNSAQKGLMRSQMSFAGGWSFSEKTAKIHLHCDFEFFLSEKTSLKSDFYYLLATQGESKTFKIQATSLTGGAFHFPKNKLDFQLSFQPGFAFIKGNENQLESTNFQEPKLELVPMTALGAGLNYFVHKYFHLFVHGKYLRGIYLGTSQPAKVSEILVSGGLGFNLTMRR